MVIKKIKNKLKSKKGATTIEFTIVLMIFLMLFSLGYELIMLGVKYLQVSNYANDIVRTISVQGGIENRVPSGFQGGDAGYKTYDELLSEKRLFAKSVGVESNDVRVIVSYETSPNTVETFDLDRQVPVEIGYLKPFEVTVDYEPNLELTQNFGAVLDNVLRKTKMGLSEYIHDYEE